MTPNHTGPSIKKSLAFNSDMNKLYCELWVMSLLIKINVTHTFNSRLESWNHAKSGERVQRVSGYHRFSGKGDLKYCDLLIFNFSDLT